MVTDGSYTCSEHSITYRVVQSLCCTPETNVTLYVNDMSIKKKQRNVKTLVGDFQEQKDQCG